MTVLKTLKFSLIVSPLSRLCYG
uniref:Uncharacterized protein n=1 Tax=Arundo donax TaxID=35708 RepID=A0A0A9CS80_ARUDO